MFTVDNAAGYSQEQLDALNSRLDMALVRHLNDSIYDYGNEIDFAAFEEDCPEEYQRITEQVLAAYDTELSA